MITNKSKGGKGKSEALRNRAVKTLNMLNKKEWNASTLGKLFERHRKTIADIIKS